VWAIEDVGKGGSKDLDSQYFGIWKENLIFFSPLPLQIFSLTETDIHFLIKFNKKGQSDMFIHFF